MLEQTITIPNATAEQVYDVLFSPEKHSKLIGDKAEVSDKVGESFSTFSGYAEGENIELVPGKKIIQTWRASDWPEGHYSIITFDFEDSEDGVTIHFSQENIPEGREAEYEAGWQDNYWEPLKKTFTSGE